MAEELVKGCYPCQIVGKNAPPEELQSTPLPDTPWSYIAVDLLTITEGNYLLVIIDYHSRWPDAVHMKTTSAANVINALERIFTTHGYPEALRSDNGQPFASREFLDYLTFRGITQLKGIPYWPQSNGEVEWFNRTILKTIRIAKINKNDWKDETRNFLFHYRTTPHTVTGLSPAKLLMNRELKDKLPGLRQIPAISAHEHTNDKDALHKLKRNLYANKKRGVEKNERQETQFCPRTYTEQANLMQYSRQNLIK